MWWVVAASMAIAVIGLFFIDQFDFFIPRDEEISDEESR